MMTNKYRTWDNVGVYKYNVDETTKVKQFLLHRPEYFIQVVGSDDGYSRFELSDRAKGDINTFVEYFKMWVNDYDNREKFNGHPKDWHKLDRINEVEYFGEEIETDDEELFNEVLENKNENYINIEFDMVQGVDGQIGFHTTPIQAEISIFNILSRTGDWWNLCRDSLQDWWFDND
jgi:hypothetical protein